MKIRTFMSFLPLSTYIVFSRHTGNKCWFKEGPKTPKTQIKLLPKRYQTLFSKKQLVCVEYRDIPDGDEREIFQVRIEQGLYHITK